MEHDLTWQAEAQRIQSDGVVAMSAFSDGISAMHGATAQVSDLCRQLLEINAADSAPEQLADLGRVIEELCQFLESWLARVNADTLRMNLLRIKGDLEDVLKLGTRFRVVASLTAVTATSGAGEMDDFIAELRVVPEQIKTAVDALLRRLATVDEVVQDAIKTAQEGLKAMGQARSILAAHSKDSGAVFQQIVQSRLAMELIGNRYLVQSQEQTKALVNGFQYSDFFAQRLDHVAQMLGREAEFGPPVRLLAARQLAGLADHGRTTVRAILIALQEQSVNSAQFTVDFTQQGNAGAEGNFGLQSIFSAVLISRERALPVIARSTASARQVLEEIRACNESFETLVDMSGVMDLAAINARLGASRENHARAAMAFLSDAVIEGAAACRQVLTTSSEGLAKVGEVQDQGMLDQLVACVARFTAAFDRCQIGLAASEARVGSLATTMAAISQQIRNSDTKVEECSRTAEVLIQIVDGLEAFGAQLTAGIAPPDVWPDMSAIYDGYTIQDERDTHDLLIGRPLSAPPTTAPVDLDDVFF